MLKLWTDEYLKDAIADEIALAAVHPQVRRKVTMPSLLTMSTLLTPDPPRSRSLLNAGAARLTLGAPHIPAWRRGWSAAGELIGELGLEIRHDMDEGTVQVSAAGQRRGVIEPYSDHPSKDAAIWAALVRAAIKVCTEARDSTY